MADDIKKAEAPTYTVERLVTDSEGFLGVASHVAVGALYGHTKDLTVEQAKAKVEAWLKRPEDKSYPVDAG